MTEITKRLAEPFPPDIVSWRVGSVNQEKTRAMALAYIDARDVMNRLDGVCGAFGWQSEHVVTGDMVTCHIRVRDPETGEWITKSDGAGKTDVEGEKGSYSDSLKRAAVAWGVGRYLYDIPAPWVEVEQKGRTVVIKDSEQAKLRAILAGKGAPTQFVQRVAPQPANIDPRIKKAGETRDYIRAQFEKCKVPADVDILIKNNGRDLEEMREVAPKNYAAIMTEATNIKNELCLNA